MSTHGSDSGPRPLHPLEALAVTGVGVLAMVSLGRDITSRLALGIRPAVALGTVLLAVPTLLALSLRPSALRAALGSRRLDGRTAGLSLLLGAALWVGSIGLLEIQSLVRPPSPEELAVFRRLHAALAPSGALDALVSLVVIALLPALCEELVMRGALLTSLSRLTGPFVAVSLTAAAFAVIHDPLRLLFAFILGLILGFLRLRTGSLAASVVAHATFNSLTFLVAPLVDDPSQPYTPQPGLGLACLVAGAAVAWPLFRALGASVDSARSAA